MPFFSGSIDMDAWIDQVADQLIATGVWATADASLAAGAHPAKRAIMPLTDPNFFVYFARNQAGSWQGVQTNEILVQVSTGFNTVTHAPSGTVQTTGIPAEGGVVTSNKVGTQYTWIDANGVSALLTWGAAAGFDYSVLFSLERNTSKEYADGFTNFFVVSLTNANASYYGPSDNTYRASNRAMILRPFNFQEMISWDNAWATFFGAYRAPGNSKVYFQFPFFSNNQVVLQRSPIAQTNRYFRVEPGMGLSDGDLVTYVQGVQTFTFLVKLLQSPDSAAYLPWAIRQA